MMFVSLFEALKTVGFTKTTNEHDRDRRPR